MTVGVTRRALPTFFRSFALAGCAMTLAAGSPSNAVVVEGLNVISPPPTGGWVGTWNGSSAVPIDPYWIITARHVGGAVGQWFTMRGQSYPAIEIRQHAWLDVQLVRVATPLPGWHVLASQPATGTPVLLGGYGATALNPLPNGNGWDWAGPRFEAWGNNILEASDSMLRIRFDAPGSPRAVWQEASFAVNDSGAGLFVVGADGSLQLAGTAVSVTGYGSSAYGSTCYCVSLHTARDWINSFLGGSPPPPPPPATPMTCDLFEFLSLWLAGDRAADVDGNGLVNADDVLAYMTAWYGSC